MNKLSGFNLPLPQEMTSDFIFHIRRFLQSRGLPYEHHVASDVVLRNEDFNEEWTDEKRYRSMFNEKRNYFYSK